MFRKPDRQIMVCNSFRTNGEAKGVCNKKGAVNLLPYLEEEILDRGLDALVCTTGCIKACDNGPVLVIQPDNQWYGKVDSEEIIDEILDALEEDTTASDYLL